MPTLQTASVDLKARQFFGRVCRGMNRFDGKLVVVAHAVSSLPPFLEALEQIAEIACLISKPKSSNAAFLRFADARTEILHLERSDFEDPTFIVKTLRSRVGSDRFATVDIGGYFAPCANELADSFPGQYLGGVEDTE